MFLMLIELRLPIHRVLSRKDYLHFKITAVWLLVAEYQLIAWTALQH
jgi:hypothetical protein